MERIINVGISSFFKGAPYFAKVERRIGADRLVMQVGLGLNALVLSIILYAELFLG